MDIPVDIAVIPAAGLGTRFLPLTKAVPKELLPVDDRPAIHYVVHEAMDAGIKHIVMVVSQTKCAALKEYFAHSKEVERMLQENGNRAVAEELREFRERLKFSYPIQDRQMGLGHAVLSARDIVGANPFAVILPDDLIVNDRPVLSQMLEIWSRYPGNYVAVEEVPDERMPTYGIVDLAPDGYLNERTCRLKGLVEKPLSSEAPSNLGIVGRYILMPDIFDALEHIKPKVGCEIQLTDGIALAMKNQSTYAYKFVGVRYDCGTPIGLLEASLSISSRRKDVAIRLREWARNINS